MFSHPRGLFDCWLDVGGPSSCRYSYRTILKVTTTIVLSKVGTAVRLSVPMMTLTLLMVLIRKITVHHWLVERLRIPHLWLKLRLKLRLRLWRLSSTLEMMLQATMHFELHISDGLEGTLVLQGRCLGTTYEDVI